MRRAIALAICCAVQDDAARIRELVAGLGAETIEEREEAAFRLKEIGRPAVPALEKATQSADLEVSSRARNLLRRIAVRERLTANLRHSAWLEDRLMSADANSWTQVFLELSPGLRREDADALVGPALAGAESDSERRRICAAVIAGGLGSAAPELTKLLGSSSGDVRAAAVEALGTLGVKEAAKEIVPLLKDPYLYVRGGAAEALGRLGAREAVAEVAGLLEDRQAVVRVRAARGLCLLGSRAGVPLMLEQPHGTDLFELNALRQPEAWKRFSGPKVPGEQIVLETDGFRLISHAEAREFWTKWWDGEKPR